MRGQEACEVILVLFLISVGVMEVILHHDRKKQPDSAAGDSESAPGTLFPPEIAASNRVTKDLLSLMDAVQGEVSRVEPEGRHQAAPERKSGDDSRGIVESDPEYNLEDAVVK
jgi:hypothetical protein